MTAVFVFVSGVGATLVGWLNDVIGWATAGGATPFPDSSILRGAVFSAGAAALTGLVNSVFRAVQERLRFGLTPDYTPADGQLGPPV